MCFNQIIHLNWRDVNECIEMILWGDVKSMKRHPRTHGNESTLGQGFGSIFSTIDYLWHAFFNISKIDIFAMLLFFRYFFFQFESVNIICWFSYFRHYFSLHFHFKWKIFILKLIKHVLIEIIRYRPIGNE